MSKLTPWFPPEVKPVYVGVYRTKFFANYSGYSYWNGSAWSFEWDSVEEVSRMEIGNQDKSWRGLAKNPQADKPVPVDWSVQIMQDDKPRRLRLTIGVQSFYLDVQDDEDGRMEWLCKQLTGAMEKLTANKNLENREE
jgi:hypothetical protein